MKDITAPKGVASQEGLMTTQEDAQLAIQPSEQPLAENDISANPDVILVPEDQQAPEQQITPDTPLAQEPEQAPSNVAPTTSAEEVEQHLANDPYTNTPAQAVERYGNNNRSKAALLESVKDDPEALIPLMAVGAIRAEDLQSHRLELLAADAQNQLNNLRSAWIESPEDSKFAAAGNTVLNALTGVTSGILAIPEALVTHYSVAAQEPKTETDQAYQTYLLGKEKLRQLALTKEDATQLKSARETAQAEYEALAPAVQSMKSELEQRDDFARTEEKYLTGYYEDNATNFITHVRKGLEGIANQGATNQLAGQISEAFDGNLEPLVAAKQHLTEGNLLKATASVFSGIAGLTAESVDAMIQNPRAIIDLTANSLGMMAAGGGWGKLATVASKGLPMAEKFGHMFMYQSMFANDAYQAFEQEYGNLPDAQQALLLNGVTALASVLATGGDEFMVNSLKKLSLRPQQVRTTAFKDVLNGVPEQAVQANAIGRLTNAVAATGKTTLGSRTAAGAATETLQEFTESLAVQYAGMQDLDKVDLKEATVEALMASGAGALTGAAGDFGSGLRKVSRGKTQNRLEEAKAGYTLNRSEITDIPSARDALTETINYMNQADQALTRDEEGNVENTQENASIVGGMYDAVLSDLAGLDGVLAGIPALEGVSLRREELEAAIREGKPLNQVISEISQALTDFSSPEAVKAAMVSNPALQAQFTQLAQQVTPEQGAQINADIDAVASAVAGITGQILSNAQTLVSNYDLDTMAKGVDTQRVATKAEQRKKIKEAKEGKKAEENQAKNVKDTADVKAKSKLTVAEVLAQADASLATAPVEETVEPEAEVEAEVTPDVTPEDITEGNVEEFVAQTESEAPLRSPTFKEGFHQSSLSGVPKANISVGNSNLAAYDSGMRQLIGSLDEKADANTSKRVVRGITQLIRELDTVSKAKASAANTSKAQALYNAIATYVDAYAASPNTKNTDLGAILASDIKLKPMYNRLVAQGAFTVDGSLVPEYSDLFARIKAATNSGTRTAKPKADTSITRPSRAVNQTKRTGTHTTNDLRAFGLSDTFSTLNTMLSAVLNDKVEDVPQEFVSDVVNTLTANAAEFDTIYTAITNSSAQFLAAKGARFKDLDAINATNQEAQASYLALVDYFKRVDPEHRDLTYVLSKYLPAVHEALETKLESAPIPTEFSKELNQAAKELVYEEVPTNRDELPTDVTEQTAMLMDGLTAVRNSGSVQEFIDILVNEEGLSETGATVQNIQAYLNDTTGDIALPSALVNPTMLSRVNSFVNQKQLPNVTKEVETDIEVTWAGNVYNGIKEALARLSLGSNAWANFSASDTKKGGMYQVFNLFTVLDNPEHENYAEVVGSFTPNELAELKRVSTLIQPMRNVYAHLFIDNEGTTPFMVNTKALDLFESVANKSSGSDNYMHPNMSAIIAQTALEFVMTDGATIFGYNNDDVAKALLPSGLQNNAMVVDAVRTGSTVPAIAPRLGKLIAKRLGIDAVASKATPEEKAQLENTLGHMALYGLENIGLIEPTTVAVSVDTKGNQHLHTQESFDFVNAPKGHKLPASNILRMYRYAEGAMSALDSQFEGFDSAFEALSLSKSTKEKLYGSQDVNDIALTQEEIVVEGGDGQLQSIARDLAENAPQYLHQGKYQLFSNLSQETQLTLFDGNLPTEGVHAVRKKAVEAKNRKAISDVARIHHTAKVLDESDTDHIYLHQRIGNNTRVMGHNPAGADPVNMSAARFLFNVEPESVVTINGGDPKVENMFYKGMAQALDLAKPEEISNERAKELFEGLADNQAMLDAVALVNASKQRELTEAENASLVQALEALDGESLMHSLDAVFVYSNYLDAKTDGTFSFDATMFVEADGKNNGTAHGLMHNAPISDLEDFVAMAKSVGINLEIDGKMTYAELKELTENFLDAYQHLAKSAGEFGEKLSTGEITDAEISDLLGNKAVEMENRYGKYQDVMRLLIGTLGSDSNKVPSLIDNGEVTSDGRKLFKQVLMTVLYGAGVSTQDNYFAATIASKHLERLEGMASTEDSPELRSEVLGYFKALRDTGISQSFPRINFNQRNWQSKLLGEEYAFDSSSFNELVSLVTNTLGVTYRAALNTPTYANIVAQANSAVESTNVVHMRLHFAVPRLLAKYKADKGIASDANLTIAQEQEFFGTRVSPLMANLSYPLASTDSELGKIKGVGLTKSTNARQHIPQSAFDAAQAQLDAAKKENPDFKGTREDFLAPEYKQQFVRDYAVTANSRTLTSQVLTRVLQAPKQSVPPSGVHATDSSTQTHLSLNTGKPFTNLYDARGGTPTSLLALEGQHNAAFTDVDTSYNLYGDMADTYAAVNEKMAETFTEEELAAIDSEVATALGQPEFNYSEYMADIQTAYNAIRDRAKEMHSAIYSIDQFPMTEDAPVVLTPSERGVLSEIKEKYADSLDLSQFPSILGSGRMADGKNLLITTTEALESDTGVVTGTIAQGQNMYSMADTEVGRIVTGTLYSLASNLRALGNAGKAKNLSDAASEIQNMLRDKKWTGKLALPNMDVNNLDADIMHFLQESDLTAATKELLATDDVQILLRNANPDSVTAGHYVDDMAANIWLNMGDNSKWMNKPLSALLYSGFSKEIEKNPIAGVNIPPVTILKAILLSPNAKGYLAKGMSGIANMRANMDLVNYLTTRNPTQFMELLQNAGTWSGTQLKKPQELATRLLAHLIVDKDKGNDLIQNKGELFANAGRTGYHYYNGLVKRITQMYSDLGYYETGDFTPAMGKEAVLSKLMNNAQAVELGLKEHVEAPVETKVDTKKKTAKDLMQDLVATLDDVEYTLTDENVTINWKGKTAPDLEAIYTNSNGKLIPIQTGDTEAVISPVLGTPTYNSMANDTTYTDLSNEPVLETYDKVAAASPVKDSKQHANYLRSLVNNISVGMEGIKIKLREVTNAPTSGYFHDNTVAISINKLLPRSVTNFMSSGETMAHEFVHAVTRNIRDVSPSLNVRAQELYQQAKAVLTVDDLIDPNLHPDDARKVARTLYDYMFTDNVVTSTYTTSVTKVEVTRTDSTRVAEFVALVTTNEMVGKALAKKTATKKQYKGLTAKVIQLFNFIMNGFFRKADTSMQDASITQETVNLVYQMSKLHNRHRSAIGKGMDTMSGYASKIMDTADTTVKDFVMSSAKWASQQPVLAVNTWTNPKSYLAAAITPVALYMGYEQYRNKFQPQFDRIGLFKNQTAQDIATELGEVRGNVSKLHDLISRRTQVIDIARQQIESSLIDYIDNRLFATEMSQTASEAMTRALLETDFNKLVKVFGADKALDVLSIDNKRLNSLRKQYQSKLKAYKYGNYYVNHAKALGEFIANGSTLYYGVHNNAYSIANLAGEGVEVETESLADIEQAVDVLASLYAVMNVPPAQRMAARKFLLEENTARLEQNPEAPKHAGLMALLQIQEDAAKEALSENFYNNPQLMRKGYIRETYNPNVELIFVSPDEVSGYEKQGFEVVSKLPTSLVHRDGEGDLIEGADQGNVMMVNHYSARLSYDQGALSHTGFKARGTTALGDFFDERVDFDPLTKTLTNDGEKEMKAAMKSMFSDSPLRVDSSNPMGIAPLRDDNGRVTGFRYTMRTSTKEGVLERESRLSHVLARTKSSVQDKVNSQSHNILVLQELYSIYDEDYSKNPDDFVFVSPNSSNPAYQEMYAMLPNYSRIMVATMNVSRGIEGTGLYVPKKLLTLTFGTPPMTLEKFNDVNNATLKVATDSITKLLNHKYGRMFSAWYKEALGTAKDTTVIKNVTTTVGNIVSNHFALSMAGVPQSTIIKKTVQGYKEIIQYQELSSKIRKIRSEIMYTPMNTTEAAKLQSLLEDLEGRVSGMSIARLIDEGLYQTIIEDVDTEVGKQTYQSKASELGDALLSKTGRAETALREGVFLTHDSMTYRYLRDAAQLSDFVSRYVLYSDMLEKGSDVETAIRESRDTFILYDAPLPKTLKNLNDLGIFNFSKFLLRTQAILHRNFRRAPVRSMMWSMVWAGFMGLSATTDVLLTPFNFMELLMQRIQLMPLGFMSNGLTELPVIKAAQAIL